MKDSKYDFQSEPRTYWQDGPATSFNEIVLLKNVGHASILTVTPA
jgi:hypothetical protein